MAVTAFIYLQLFVFRLAQTEQIPHCDAFDSSSTATWSFEGGNCWTSVAYGEYMVNCDANAAISLTKSFSTAGYTDIIISFDFKANRANVDILSLSYNCGASDDVLAATYQVATAQVAGAITYGPITNTLCEDNVIEVIFNQLPVGQMAIYDACISGTPITVDHTTSATTTAVKPTTTVKATTTAMDQFVTECGSDTISPEYHIGDRVQDIQSVIDDICSSAAGEILVQALSVIPVAGTAASVLCSSVSFLGALCDLLSITQCDLDKTSSIVASCWSSDIFEYSSVSSSGAIGAFESYLSDEYDISLTVESTEAVLNEKYSESKVTLDNCGNDDNYWIGGVYDGDDNGQQNDVVSDVVEYLVRRGIISSDNPVGGVSSVDQTASDGVDFTEVVRSKNGLLLHYDELDCGIHCNYGIYFCEFNVVDIDDDTNVAHNVYSVFIPFIIAYIAVIL
eukprot:421838_1